MLTYKLKILHLVNLIKEAYKILKSISKYDNVKINTPYTFI